MRDHSDDRTASLMTPAKLARLKVRPEPVASAAAWLDQLAADAGSGQARRLVDLRRQLEAQARANDYGPVQQALLALAGGLEALSLDTLNPAGWLARATGRRRERMAEFLERYEQVLAAGEHLKDSARALLKQQQAQEAASSRTLVAVDVEVKEIERIIDQGARWLQDMRGQLKARELQPADAAALQAIEDDSRRCELLVDRLKCLRTASSAAQDMALRCRSAATRRVALLEALEHAQDDEWKPWEEAMGPIVDLAVATGSGGEDLPALRSRHEQLRRAITQAAAGCAQLQEQELALAGELAGLRQPLQAAA